MKNVELKPLGTLIQNFQHVKQSLACQTPRMKYQETHSDPLNLFKQVSSSSTSNSTTCQKKNCNLFNDKDFCTPSICRQNNKSRVQRRNQLTSTVVNEGDSRSIYYENLQKTIQSTPKFIKDEQIKNQSEREKKKKKAIEKFKLQESLKENSEFLKTTKQRRTKVKQIAAKIEPIVFLKKFNNQLKTYSFPCYKETDLPFYKGKETELSCLQRLSQDDDVSSDDEVVYQGIKKCLSDIASAFSDELSKESSSKAQKHELEVHLFQKLLKSYENKQNATK